MSGRAPFQKRIAERVPEADRLAELIDELRREGVRSSKKELIEMCLSELPAAPTEELRTWPRSYRAQLPRDL